jgi:ClpP class serine protease
MKEHFKKLREANPQRILALFSDYTDGDTEQPEMPEIYSSPIEIIPFFGEITKGTGLSEQDAWAEGLCDIDLITPKLKAVQSDPNCLAAVLWFRSPGGELFGVKETADLIAEISQTKLVLGFTDTLCASAAYWIASACSYIFTNEAAKVGNVGAFAERLDLTEQLKQQGVKLDIVKDGEFKTFGHPATVMTDQEKADIQHRVSLLADSFRQTVMAHRSIDPSLLQGQVFLGVESVSNGFADGIVPDIETVFSLAAVNILTNP